MKRLPYLLIGCALFMAAAAHADSQTPRAGMTVIDINSVGWGPKVNANTSIIDSSAALQGQPNVFTAPNTYTSSAPVTAASATVTNLHCGTCTVANEIVLPDGSVITSTAPFTPISVYPASATASFPFGASASTITVSTLTVNQIPLIMNYNGQNVVSIGQGALPGSSSGIDMAAVGTNALASNTIGNKNSAFGNFALFSNTTGSNHAAFGQECMESVTTGIEDSGFGEEAGRSVTTGQLLSIFGWQSMFSATTGNKDSSFGANALQNLVSGSSTTGVGFKAGFNELGSGDTYLGTNSGPSSLATLTDACAIGNQAVVNSSFTCQIGGLPGSGHEVNVKTSSFTLSGNLTFGDGTVQTSTSGFAPASGSANYIANTSVQENKTLNVTSGTVQNLNTTTLKFADGTSQTSTSTFAPASGSTNYVQIGNSLQPNSTFYVGLASATAVDTGQLNLPGGAYFRIDNTGHLRARSGPAGGGIFELHTDSGALVLGDGPTTNPVMVLNGSGSFEFKTSLDGGVTFQDMEYTSQGNLSIPFGLFVHAPSPGTAPDPSAIFEADSSTQGVLITRMSVGQRNAISSPANGLVVYDTTSATVDYYNGTSWVSLSTSAGGGGSTAFTPIIVATTTRTNVVADISSTTLFIAPSTGIYTTHIYAVATSSDATAGQVLVSINYNDDSFTPFGGTGQSVGVASVNLAGSPGVNAGNATNAVFPFEAVNGSTITYSSAVTGTYGTAKYNLYISVEQMH